MRDKIWQYMKLILNLMIAFAVLLIVIIAVPRLLAFFMPFVIGWIISLIANPLVKFLEEKLRIRRKAVSAFVIVFVISLIILLGYVIIANLIEQLIGFIAFLPSMWKGLEEDLAGIGKNMNVFYERLPKDVQEWLATAGEETGAFFTNMVSSIGTPTMSAVGSFAKNIPSAIINAIMCVLSAYFFIAEKDFIYFYARKLTTKSFQEKWSILFTSLKQAIGGYFKAQLKIEIWVYLLLLTGFLILKIQYGFLIALGIAFLDFLPIFGAGAVMIPWAIVKFLSADYKLAIGILIMWGVGQLVRQIIQPKMIGDSIGVAPIPTLFLLYIGYKLAGVFGMIIAVPIGIIVVNLDHAGIFDTTKDSLRLLIGRINDFRRLNESDRAYLKQKDAENMQGEDHPEEENSEDKQ